MKLCDSPLSVSAAARLKETALGQLALGDGAAAFDGLSRAFAVLPDDAEVAFHLGTLALQGGALEAAIGHLERALELAPEVTAIHNNLATALLKAGQAEARPLYPAIPTPVVGSY